MTEPENQHAAETTPHAATTEPPPARDAAPARPVTAQHPEHQADAPGSDDRPPARRETAVPPWISAAGFVILAGAIGFAWWHPRPVAAPDATPLHDLKQQVEALELHLGQLENRPAAAADLKPLADRIAALEHRPTPDPAPLDARVSALEHQALEHQAPDAQRLAAQMQTLSHQVEALSGLDRGADARLAQRLDTDEARLSAMQHDAAQASAETARLARLVRIQAAQIALNAGQPLGDIAGAPAAVARFAATAPPTAAALRLGFPKAARAALAASQPDTTGKPFLSRMLRRAENLVTIRQGDRVVVGDSAAGVLARARAELDAGDLAGTVAAVAALSGPAANAMAGWRAEAQSVLDARAGLAAMAAAHS